ncbi:MAG: serine/threonine-protein kinase [Gemmatimonadaceae bacterium]
MSTTATTLLGGRYEIGRALGQGAFGHTVLAHDRQEDRAAAIKVLDSRVRDGLKSYELFKREADVLRAVRHHGIPEVFDAFQDQWLGAPAAFLVMEYVEGTSLARIIDEKRTLDPGELAHIFLELLGILDYLHGRVPPILHRDIKPSNIIVRPNGFPALVDFGSVRRVFMGPEESGSTIAGTYGYMPYEQYMGQASPASDLYALGGTMLHLLTGRPPRDFMSDAGIVAVPETLPGESRLRTVIARLLRASPAERFVSARDVRSALIGTVAVARTDAAPRVHLASVAHAMDALTAMPPAPRPIAGDTKRLLKSVSPSALRLMNASDKDGYSWSLMDVLGVGFFSLVTAGILPMVFLNMASARKRRLRRFFRDGLVSTGEVLKIESETTAFDEKISRVSYEFEVDGLVHRDSDTVVPGVTARWKAGDRVPILYLPDRDYDSVIIAVQ